MPPGRKRGEPNKERMYPCRTCGVMHLAQSPMKNCYDCAKRKRYEKGKRDYERRKKRLAAQTKKSTKELTTMDDRGRLRSQDAETRYILVFDALQDAPMCAGMPISAFDFDCMKRFDAFEPGSIVYDRRTQEEIVL